MYAQVEKPKENKSQAVANSVTQKKGTLKQDYSIINNRPEAIAQRKLQKILNTSARKSQPVQRENAVDAGILDGGYQRTQTNRVLSNTDRVKGNVYKSETEAVRKNSEEDTTIFKANNEYASTIGTLGNKLVGKTFLDTTIAIDVDKALGTVFRFGEWEGEKRNILKTIMAGQLFYNGGDIGFNAIFPLIAPVIEDDNETDASERDRKAAYRLQYNRGQQLLNNFKNDREQFRDKREYNLLDPFMVSLWVPVEDNDDNGEWQFLTEFSNSASGYIVEIRDPEKQARGKMVQEDSYDTEKQQPLANSNDYIYSSKHESGTIGAHLASEGKEGERDRYSKRFDAETRLLAEGARFKPVRELGSDVKDDTKLVTVEYTPNYRLPIFHWVDYRLLINRWGDWFNKAYNIDAGKVATEIYDHSDTGDVHTNNTHSIINNVDGNQNLRSPRNALKDLEGRGILLDVMRSGDYDLKRKRKV